MGRCCVSQCQFVQSVGGVGLVWCAFFFEVGYEH